MAQLELVHPAAIDMGAPAPRGDHEAIVRLVSDGARVLDVGCSDGSLMRTLMRECGAHVRGLEIEPAKVHGCVARGLSVVQGDAERDLDQFPSAAFEYVVFSHTLFQLDRPLAALKAAARVGERVIVAFDNAAHWPSRLRLMFNGRLARWNDATPVSVRDFAEAARGLRLTIERALPVSNGHVGAPFARTLWRANWFAQQAVFLLSP
jgi:methionine biosynthesis protein MetW